MLGYGYNRDGDGLAQIKLSLVVDRDIGVAVTYEIYPKSIVDVSTLKGTIERLNGYGVKECLMVLER